MIISFRLIQYSFFDKIMRNVVKYRFPRNTLLSATITTSPRRKFLVLTCHFRRTTNVGTYTCTHFSQKSSTAACTRWYLVVGCLLYVKGCHLPEFSAVERPKSRLFGVRTFRSESHEGKVPMGLSLTRLAASVHTVRNSGTVRRRLPTA